MQPKLLKYVLDIESVVKEIESIKQKAQNDFNNFSNDIILQRAVERDLEIIGEAIRKIILIDLFLKRNAPNHWLPPYTAPGIECCNEQFGRRFLL